MTLGKKLQDLRKKKKLRQYELAELIGVSQKNICTLEAREDIYLSTLKKYITSLGGELKIYAEYHEEGIIYDLSKHIKDS